MPVPEIPNTFFNNPPAAQADAFPSKPRALPADVSKISIIGGSMLAYADESRGYQRLGDSANAPPFPDSEVDILSQVMAAIVVRNGPGTFELNIIAVDRQKSIIDQYGHSETISPSAAISVDQQGLGMPFIMPSPTDWPFGSEDRLYDYVNTTTSYVNQQLRTGDTKDKLYGKLLRYAMRGLRHEGPHDVASVQLVAFYTPATPTHRRNQEGRGNQEGRAPTILLVPWGPSNEAKRLAFVEGDKLGFSDPLPIRTWSDMSQEVNNQVAIMRNHRQNNERSTQAILSAPGTAKGVICAFSRHC